MSYIDGLEDQRLDLKAWLANHTVDDEGYTAKKAQAKALKTRIKQIFDEQESQREMEAARAQAARGKRARSPTNQLKQSKPDPTGAEYDAPSKPKIEKVKGSVEDEPLRNLMFKQLPKSLDDFQLKDMVEPFGLLERWKIVQDAEKMSKGFGFVKYASVEHATECMRKLNGSVATSTSGERKIIKVEYADKQGAEALLRAQKAAVASGGAAENMFNEEAAKGGPDVLRNIIVNHLADMDEVGLREMFIEFGPLDNVKLMYESGSSVSKGFGFVKFANSGDAATAIGKADGRKNSQGKKIKVAYAKWKEASDLLRILKKERKDEKRRLEQEEASQKKQEDEQ